jgi:ABC-2 type transport system ATP-binding protein
LTILLTTHYPEEVDQLAARVAISIVGGSSPRDPEPSRPNSVATRSPSSCASAPTSRASVRPCDGPGLGEIRLERTGLRVAAGPALPGVPGALMPAAAVAAATVSRPSLDDVYIRHTGRSFAAAERTSKELPDDRRHRHAGHLVRHIRAFSPTVGSPTASCNRSFIC